MNVEIAEESVDGLAEYATIPIAFEVRPAVVKDYDAIPDNAPLGWPRRFDLGGWTFFAARSAAVRVGGAAVAIRTPTVAVVYDIRVAPLARRQGVGLALVGAIEEWAGRRGISWLEVETQDNNVPAHRFYLSRGFTVTEARPGAYKDFPSEVQLLMHKRLAGPHSIPGVITTPRLVLRRWRKAEAAELKAAIDDNLPHLQAWMPWAMAEPSLVEIVEERVAKFETQFDSGVEWLFAIRSRETDAVLGGTGLHARVGPDGLEIGYWLRRDATGKGFATEAAEALTRVALEQPGLRRVQIRCDPRNVASAGIPRRLGYRHLRTIEGETFAPDGSQRDTMVWEMT